MSLNSKIVACCVCLATMALSGCDLSQQGAVDKGMEMVASTLKDPGSARFGPVFMVENDVIGEKHYGYLCGSVNSKNSFGAFTGSRRFSAYFSYTKRGSIEVSNVTLEEGTNAETNRAGVSYFQDAYWYGRCEARPVVEPAAPEPAAKSENKNKTPASSPKKNAAPTATAKPDGSQKSTAPKRSGWSVQVLSLSDAGKAKALADKIGAAGKPSYVTTSGTAHRVFSGPYESRERAEAASAELLKTQQLRGIVVRNQE